MIEEFEKWWASVEAGHREQLSRDVDYSFMSIHKEMSTDEQIEREITNRKTLAFDVWGRAWVAREKSDRDQMRQRVEDWIAAKPGRRIQFFNDDEHQWVRVGVSERGIDDRFFNLDQIIDNRTVSLRGPIEIWRLCDRMIGDLEYKIGLETTPVTANEKA